MYTHDSSHDVCISIRRITLYFRLLLWRQKTASASLWLLAWCIAPSLSLPLSLALFGSLSLSLPMPRQTWSCCQGGGWVAWLPEREPHFKKNIKKSQRIFLFSFFSSLRRQFSMEDIVKGEQLSVRIAFTVSASVWVCVSQSECAPRTPHSVM